MQKPLRTLLAFFITLILAACNTPDASPATPAKVVEQPAVTSTATLTPPVPATAAPAVVVFNDPVLEALLRASMGKRDGGITAPEAQAVTRLDLNMELPRRLSEDALITDISGLEKFTNLENLDLSHQAITDISALQGLTKLTTLSLSGNPIGDITPLAQLTSLKGLALSNCVAQDYSPLANLVNLEILFLDHASITDVSPLASLANLQQLYLANSPVSDYSPLADLYPGLVNKDFTIAFTLKELGFSMNHEMHLAKYANENMDVIMNHSEWGAPPMEWDANLIRLSMNLEDGYNLSVGFYGDLDAYVFGMVKDGQTLMNYVFDPNNGGLNVGLGERESLEQVVRAAIEVMEGEDALLAPVRIFDEVIRSTFNMSAEALYALPYGPPTLKNLGFFPDEANAVWRYEQREGWDVNLEIHRPEWGEKDYEFLFFSELSDEYRIVITYYSDEKKFVVGADDNSLGGADFEFFLETQEHIDGYVSNKELTVEQYFLNAFGDPEIEDIYLYSIELVRQYIQDRFGMSFEELLALPVDE